MLVSNCWRKVSSQVLVYIGFSLFNLISNPELGHEHVSPFKLKDVILKQIAEKLVKNSLGLYKELSEKV